MKTTNIKHKKKLLKEHYSQTPQEITFNEWLSNELYYNPTMGRWLADNDNMGDYYLPDDYKKLYDEE